MQQGVFSGVDQNLDSERSQAVALFVPPDALIHQQQPQIIFRGYKCPACEKQPFEAIKHFTKHLFNKHTDGKRQCPKCERNGFSRNENFAKHVVIHSPKPYQCGKCFRSFTRIIAEIILIYTLEKSHINVRNAQKGMAKEIRYISINNANTAVV